jgi:tRNA G10  N-methylase Trm11
MGYLFILGRNPELSIEEINSYFRKIENRIISSEQNKNSVLIETDKKIEKGTVNMLGGTIAIGEVLCSIDFKDMEKQNIYVGTSNKLNYVIWNFSKDNSYNKVSEHLKKRFKEEQLKATEKNLNGSLELQDGKNVRIASGLIDEEYFVFNNYFGKIIEKCNYGDIEQRDMGKPVRRHALSISPRLAKIMINLSEVKK